MPFKNIDMSLLRTFTLIVEAGTFAKAAVLVERTQSAVTQQMQRLEKELDIELFRHKGQSKELTRSGQKIYDLAKGVLQLNDAILTEVNVIKRIHSGK